jgi:D-beta-D-heptose 7-phosphate kinase/D-beta-D-heptose 1-phosphate adenosyltransferase
MTRAPGEAQELVRRFAGVTAAVVGDVMLDHFIVGGVDRISPEAPVPVVRFAREQFRLGGAANVAHNVVALGGRADLAGLVGVDDAAGRLRQELAAAGVSVDGLVADEARPTTRKVRVVTPRHQQVARIDYETDGEPDGVVAERLTSRAASAAGRAAVTVLSDYRKGVVSPPVIRAVIEAAERRGGLVLVDPKTPVADRYAGVSVVTPNHHEAELMTQTRIRHPEDARTAARELHARTGARVLITLGEHGMWVFDPTVSPATEESIPSTAREVADVTGAGDTVIGVVALGLGAGGSLVQAARLANAAAGIVVGRWGPAVLSAAELGTYLFSTETGL